MRRTVCLLGLATGIIGCGGASGLVPNVYVGTYQGSFSAPSTSQSGSVTLTIGQNGDLGGTTTQSGTNTVSDISGTIDDSGNMSGNLTQAGTTNTDPFTGQLTITPPTATANLNVTASGGTVADTWTFTSITSGLSERTVKK